MGLREDYERYRKPFLATKPTPQEWRPTRTQIKGACIAGLLLVGFIVGMVLILNDLRP